MTVNAFDQAARFTAQKLDPIGFLRWAVPGLDPSVTFLNWLDTRTLPFPGSPDRICDTVAELAGDAEDDPRRAVVVEFQTEPDPEMLDRLLEYLARLRRGLRSGPDRRGKYHVAAALISLTGPPQPDTLEMSLPGAASPSLFFRVASRTLRDEDAVATLRLIASGEVSPCILSWISLMRGGGDPDIINSWRQVAEDIEPDPHVRTSYGAIACVFSQLTGCEVQWLSGLEGWNMRESTVLNKWLAESKAEGKVEDSRDRLLELLGGRLGTPIPADIVKAIEGQADLDVLSRWFKVAITTESFDAFREELRG